MAIASEARQLAIEKLMSSGLTEPDLRLLRMQPLEADQTLKPSETGVCAYFPTNVDWKPILPNVDAPLIITEGELKAAKACKEGFPTIGLGGVRSYMNSRLLTPFLHELEAVNWVRRTVYIIYDSDFRTNEDICDALARLAEQLYLRGARPYFVPLPDLDPDGKTGLDDFLVRQSRGSLHDLIVDNKEELTIGSTLWRLNEKVLYVQDPGLILRTDTGQKMSPSSFTNHAFNNLTVPEQVLQPNGDISMRLVPTAVKWLGWPFRAETKRITYMPGQPTRMTETQEYNTWPGWGCEPRKGDVSLFLKLLDHLFQNATPEEKRWFLRWLAYPLQHPGTKMFTSALLHGIKQGTGKSLIGYTMGAVYGRNFTEIKQADLESGFTEWAQDKQFILADDVTGTDSRHRADILKSLITQRDMRINIKYVPSYTVPDCINYLFTSNQPDAMFLENDDRRTFIWEVLAGPLPKEFYDAYDTALNKKQVLGPAVFDYLMKLDLGDFSPRAHAMLTQAKANMITTVKSDVGAWVQQLVEDPDSVLRVGKIKVVGDLFTTKELLRLYDPINNHQVTANGLGRELRRAGIHLFRNGMPLRTSKGLNRYFIVRNAEKWIGATPAAAIKHLSVGG